MPSIGAVIERLLPKGSRGGGRVWELCPDWPPDVFAVAATLVDLSGCYAGPLSIGRDLDAFVKESTTLADDWSAGATVPKLLQQLWARVLDNRAEQVAPLVRSRGRCDWQNVALKLLAVSDQAAAGIGFNRPSKPTRFSVEFLRESRKLALGENRERLMHLPWTTCVGVPPDEACVQPKARTPQVGCTLATLSHHLSLLPSVGKVHTHWVVATTKATETAKPLNLLLVPYPFRISGKSFEPVRSIDGGGSRSSFFAVRQEWLPGAQMLQETLVSMINEAGREVSRVHGLVLPELALRYDIARDLARKIAVEHGLELFVSGVLTPPDETKRLPRNGVYSAVFSEQKLWSEWFQAKHHRWRLDGLQIRRYHLGDALDPDRAWWESSDIAERALYVQEFRDGATIATLVCEDLSRIEPVQPVIRALGPNLVVAILMDGPQKKDRWSARYATVLADDPGSSVLTLTSHGMVRRSWMPGEKKERQIGLWKETGQTVVELNLPRGAGGLLLSLSLTTETEYSLDGRSDNGASYKVSLAGVRPISRPKAFQ